MSQRQMMQQSVSWLLPVAPDADPDWLAECMNSVFECSKPLREYELVIILDDGAGKGNQSLRDGIVTQLSLPERVGVAVALNCGLAVAKYPLIARIDADDRCLPSRMTLQMPLMADGIDVSGGGMLLDDGSGRIAELPPNEISEQTLRKYLPICFHPTWIIRRSILLECDGWPTAYPHAEDFALACRMWKMGCKFANHGSPLIVKRQHPKRVSNVFRKEQRESAKRAVLELL